MDKYLEKLPIYVDELKSIKDTIITNILFIGETPAPTFQEKRRGRPFFFLPGGSPVAGWTPPWNCDPTRILPGSSPPKPTAFVIVHLL